MRIIRKLATFSLIGIITFGLGAGLQRCGSAAKRYVSEPSAWQVLLSFENQDLEGLDEQSLRRVLCAIETITATVQTKYSHFEPRLFRKISNSNGEPRYILVEERPMRMIPGESIIRAHIFDTAGKVLSNAEFSTGNRIVIMAMGLRKNYWLKSEVLRLDGEPVFTAHPIHQYYMIVGNELRLVYLEFDGHVEGNSYSDPGLTIGPRLNFSADDWERDLQSTDDARVLSALTWLGGGHWEGQEPPYDEDRPDGEKVKDLRARESVRRRLADLTNSDNYFIKRSAEAIAKQ
jgi:hypothetical protein